MKRLDVVKRGLRVASHASNFLGFDRSRYRNERNLENSSKKAWLDLVWPAQSSQLTVHFFPAKLSSSLTHLLYLNIL